MPKNDSSKDQRHQGTQESLARRRAKLLHHERQPSHNSFRGINCRGAAKADQKESPVGSVVSQRSFSRGDSHVCQASHAIACTSVMLVLDCIRDLSNGCPATATTAKFFDALCHATAPHSAASSTAHSYGVSSSILQHFVPQTLWHTTRSTPTATPMCSSSGSRGRSLVL